MCLIFLTFLSPTFQSLNLSHNHIQLLHERSLEDLTTLEHLRLDHNRLTHLPATAFRPLQQLRSLRLDHNRLCGIDPTAFQGLTRLISLNLAINQLRFAAPNNDKSNRADSPFTALRLPASEISTLSGNALDFGHSYRPTPVLGNNCSQDSGLSQALRAQYLTALEWLDLSGNPLGQLQVQWSPFALQSRAFLDSTTGTVMMQSFHQPANQAHTPRTAARVVASRPVQPNWVQLTTLYLNNSQLSLLDGACFAGLPHLRQLNLQQNLITVSTFL